MKDARLYLGLYKSFLVVDRRRRLIIPALYLGALAFAADAVLRFAGPPSGASPFSLLGSIALLAVVLQAHAGKVRYQRSYDILSMSRSPALTLFILSFGISIAAFLVDLIRFFASAVEGVG